MLSEERDFYYSNTWLNFTDEENGFAILHKGIHAWDKKYVTQEWRQKRDYAISAHLGLTNNEWVPGMVRMNTQFGEGGILAHEFRLKPGRITDDYILEKSSREYLYDCPWILTGKHEGQYEEKEFLKITSGNAFISAFYADLTHREKTSDSILESF